jgi:molecular chaperone HtpG
MANIILPERFKNILEKNQELDGIIKTTLATFGEILEESKLYFFYEYTNHGIKHIQDVLASSDNLITDETFSNILSDKDIASYILSVILHDIGMHIDLEGFKCLINGEYDDIQIKELDSLKWSELWEDFINEARKFSGKQLKAIFGSEDTIIRIPPFSKPGDITENDKKLIGEFIRRHHARIAHEIAIKGFPAKPNSIEFCNSLDIKIKSIVGLIARSHGTNLRRCLDYIENKFGRESKRFPNGIHATYLMVLLRIADYIQIDSSRTSKALLKSKTFSSPVSEMEHNAHLSIDNIDYKWNGDPERIFVNASPTDSKMFIKLKKLFKDIQYEFDMSWAVLGELYGNVGEEIKPKIKFRRITSNLDTTTFIDQQNYVADSFSFKTNDEIIKLLVAPLYGDNIIYGVRELLQNSIDACKEREYIEKQEGNLNYTPSITVNIEKEEDGHTYFKIVDNGLGMDIEIIKNYFLSAGASYRKSLDWQKEFLDNNGKAKIRRSGRFGVGILSAFLIGKEISIETKKHKSHQGYKFSANLNTELINVLKNSNIEGGTHIKIQIDEFKIDKFKKKDYENYEWTKWYTLSKPKIKFLLYGKKIIPYKNFNPDNNESIPNGWNAIDSLGYDKILWTYNTTDFTNVELTCNGIVIPESYNSRALNFSLLYSIPHISIFDNNAVLPLTLDRNSISESLSFEKDLLEDIYKDFIAYLLIFDKNSYIKGEKLFLKDPKLNHPSTKNDYYHLNETSYGFNQYSPNRHNLKEFLNTILICKKGFIINYSYFIQKLKEVNALLIQFNSLPEGGFDFDIQNHFVLFSESKSNSIYDYKNAIEADTWNNKYGRIEPFNSRIFLKTEKYDYLFKSKTKRLSTWLKDKSQFQYEKEGFTCLHMDNPKESIITEGFLNKNSSNLHFIREYNITCPFDGDEILNKLLEKYIGNDVIIPFSLEERKKKYPLAFLELERYMKKYSDSTT